MICTVSLAMRRCGDRDGEVTVWTQGHEGGRETAEHRQSLGIR